MASRNRISIRKAALGTKVEQLEAIDTYLETQLKNEYKKRIKAKRMRNVLKMLNRLEFDFFSGFIKKDPAILISAESLAYYASIRKVYGKAFRVFDSGVREKTNRPFMLSGIATTVADVETGVQLTYEALLKNLNLLLTYGRKYDCLTLHCARILSWCWIFSTLHDMPTKQLYKLADLINSADNPLNMYDQNNPTLSLPQVLTTQGTMLLSYDQPQSDLFQPVMEPPATPIRYRQIENFDDLPAASSSGVNPEEDNDVVQPLLPEMTTTPIPDNPLLSGRLSAPGALLSQRAPRSRINANMFPTELAGEFYRNRDEDDLGARRRRAAANREEGVGRLGRWVKRGVQGAIAGTGLAYAANVAQRAAQQLRPSGGGNALTTLPSLNRAANNLATPRIAGLLTDGRQRVGAIASFIGATDAAQKVAQQSPLRGFIPAAPNVLEKATNIAANAVQGVVQQSPLRGFMATAPSVLDRAANLTANAVQGVVQQSPLLGFVPTAPSVATDLTANAAQRAAQQLQVWGGGNALTTIPALNQATNLTAGTTPRIAGLLTDGREPMGVIARSIAVIQDVASSLGSLAANNPWWTAAGLAATGLAGYYAINRRLRNRTRSADQPSKRVSNKAASVRASKQLPATLPTPPNVLAQRKSSSKKATALNAQDASDLPALLPVKSKSRKPVDVVAPAAANTNIRQARPKPILKKGPTQQQAVLPRAPRVRNAKLTSTRSSVPLRRADTQRARRSPRGGAKTPTPTPANRRRRPTSTGGNRRANTGAKPQQARARRSPATTSPSNRRRRAAA